MGSWEGQRVPFGQFGQSSRKGITGDGRKRGENYRGKVLERVRGNEILSQVG